MSDLHPRLRVPKWTRKVFRMGETMSPAPNPGSPAAKEAGCTCPVIDNSRGYGLYTDDDGHRVFVVAGGCPLHDKDAER